MSRTASARMGGTVPRTCCVVCWRVLSRRHSFLGFSLRRSLPATRDRSGYIRFRRWRFYAEEGLAKQQVQISIYTSTLKIEYQDTELAFYTMEWAEDDTHIKEVKNPRLIETGYQSSQLKLWTLGPDEWLLFLKLPDYTPRTKRKPVEVIQLPLPDIDEDKSQAVSS